MPSTTYRNAERKNHYAVSLCPNAVSVNSFGVSFSWNGDLRGSDFASMSRWFDLGLYTTVWLVAGRVPIAAILVPLQTIYV